jgi:hypothetical protein
MTRNPGGSQSIGRFMRSFVVLGSFVLLASACTKHNPDSCCATVEQCGELGISGITLCDTGRTCDTTGTCVAVQCISSADCTSADAPICENQLCVAKCTTDDECTGISGRTFCATDGMCVACTSDAQCSADAPICDASARACRGCGADDECAGGICLESDGTCRLDSDVFFVTAAGTDSGACTRSDPCLTIPFVLAKPIPQYKYIHLLGGTYNLNGATMQVGSAAYIDGSNTIIGFGGSGPLIHFSFALGGGVLSNITLAPASNAAQPAILVDGGGDLKIFNSTIKKGIKITAGTLSVSKSTFVDPNDVDVGVDCSAGATVSVTGTSFTPSIVNSTGCKLTLEQNRFDSVTGTCFGAIGGTAVIENNVFTGSTQFDDCGSFSNLSAGSTVRFNTFVNTSDVVADGSPLHCDQTAEVTSNIFAWGSTAPTASGCTPKYSLFDNATTEPLDPTSQKADIATFFVDRAAKNFHLAPNSPAIGKAQPGLPVTTDFDGSSRPSPSNSTPDIGAYEAQ